MINVAFCVLTKTTGSCTAGFKRDYCMEKKTNLTNWFWRVILLAFPMLHLTLGVDIADIGYNLANFEAFPHFNETWMLSTLLAHLVGKLMTFLPFGNTMMGVHFYCLLLLGGFAVLIFELLRKDMSPRAVFAGELLALCLCWSPKYILYQYLTYYLFCIAALLLVKGLAQGKNRLLFISGMVLGANLFVRFPNIVETLLIVLVLYAAILKKTAVKDVMIQIVYCMSGFFIVSCTGILLIEFVWGFGSYAGMIEGLFFMTEEATSYSPVSMVRDTLLVYAEYLKWIACLAAGTVAGYVVWVFLNKKWMKIAFFVVFCMGFGLILLFFRSRGIWTFQFNEYVSVYPWMMFLLIFTILFALGEIIGKGIPVERRIVALMILCVIAITPLGSNNNVYSNFNNLFLVAPYLFGCLLTYFPKWKEKVWKPVKAVHIDAYPVMLMIVLVLCVTMFQGICFGVQFAFRDEGLLFAEHVTITENEKLQGMKTNAETAATLESLTAFMKENGYYGNEALFFGHIPMVSYACEMPCAVSHTWPSLASYPTSQYREELAAVEGKPVVVYEATYYGDLLQKDASEVSSVKESLLMEFMRERNYYEVYRNEKYVVCVAQ